MSCARLADDEIKASDWKFICCNNIPKQDNAFDCELYCASNLYSIVNCKKLNDTPFSNSSEGRDWMKNILMTGYPKNMDCLVQKVTKFDNIKLNICGFEKCKKEPDHKEPQGMCVSFRKWLHLSCEELQILKFVPFYSKCADCYPEEGKFVI